MRVIMTCDKRILKLSYSSYTITDDFKWVEENKDDIDVFIFHSSKESDFTIGVNLSKLSQKGNMKFYYINEHPQTTIAMTIAGAGGRILTDEFYFSSNPSDDGEGELNCLIADDDAMQDSEENTTLANTSIQVINEFMEAFENNDAKIHIPAYLSAVKDSIVQLSRITQEQEIQIVEMGNSAIDIFKKASKLIQNLNENKKNIEIQLNQLEQNIQTQTSLPNATFNSQITMYPPINWMGITKVLLIKEHSPCRYLTSFAMGYAHHLHYSKNVRVKLIIVHQKGAEIASKYSDFTFIDDNSARYDALYQSEHIATNTPTKEVMNKLLKQKEEVAIVVDRLYGTQPIVDGKVTRIDAVGSLRDIERYTLDPKNTLVSIQKSNDVLGVLFTTRDYATDRDTRIATYEQLYDSLYDLLDRDALQIQTLSKQPQQ